MNCSFKDHLEVNITAPLTVFDWQVTSVTTEQKHQNNDSSAPKTLSDHRSITWGKKVSGCNKAAVKRSLSAEWRTDGQTDSSSDRWRCDGRSAAEQRRRRRSLRGESSSTLLHCSSKFSQDASLVTEELREFGPAHSGVIITKPPSWSSTTQTFEAAVINIFYLQWIKWCERCRSQ